MWSKITSMLGEFSAKSSVAIKPHIPLIKFPNRGPAPKPQGGAGTGVANPVDNVINKSSKPVSKGSKGPAIESSELPNKYRRKPLSSEEIEIIEKGGKV